MIIGANKRNNFYYIGIYLIRVLWIVIESGTCEYMEL